MITRSPGRWVRQVILAAVVVLAAAAAGAQSGDAGFESIRADALEGHVYFLAAPEMGGRDSLSHEGRIAANYIAAFHRLGLTPAGDDGTYFQNFPMTQAVIDRSQTRLRATVATAAGSSTARDFVLGADFTLARQGGVDVDVTAPLVFAGYGIDAPEYGDNDYAGLDVFGNTGLNLDYKADQDDRANWFARSDQYPFALKGVPMVLFNMGEHPDFDTANDMLDRIDYPKMERIVRLVYLTARELAATPSRPRFVTE